MVLWFVSSFKILLSSLFVVNNFFDYLSLGIWLISNMYFIYLTFFELYRYVFKNEKTKYLILKLKEILNKSFEQN